MGALGDLIQSYIDGQTFPPSDSALARRLGVVRTTITNWRRGETMPRPEHVRALSTLTGLPHTRILDAALVDAGYLPKELGHESAAPTTPAGSAPAAPQDVDADAVARLLEEWRREVERFPNGPLVTQADRLAHERAVTERFVTRLNRVKSGESQVDGPGSSRDAV